MREYRGFPTTKDHELLRTVTATRYVTPLREGGSLPAIVEADDLGTYVLKFRGAGQGRKALIAELVAGEIGRCLGLPVPEIVLAHLDPDLGRAEPDPEIQDLLKASSGLNLALDYLPGSLGFDPLVEPPGPELASRILWFDALVQNVDRTPRNTNLLVWHGRLWLIDHGAALYFHHNWPGRESAGNGASLEAVAQRPYAAARDHVLLPFAGALQGADAALATVLTPEALRDVLALIPDAWISDEPGFGNAEEVRAAYLSYLTTRLREPRVWAHALEQARDHIQEVGRG
ncbi:MAG TPA: HipA family kinase [Rubrobacteraceae bacterium]|nr:HipA family kinase [Rubrobacteraceae bacterium]